MNQEQVGKALTSLLESVGFLHKNVEFINKNVDSLNKRVDSLSKNVDSLNKNVDSLSKNVDSLNENVGSLNKNVDFLRENMVTKKYAERFATKDELAAVNSNIVSHIDGFVGMYQRTDTEIVALRSKCYRLESHVHQLAKHTDLTLE